MTNADLLFSESVKAAPKAPAGLSAVLAHVMPGVTALVGA